MELDHTIPEKIAQQYLKIDKPPIRLGWGIGGHVYLSPDLRTAVKVHRRQEGFFRELQVYLRLRALNITEVHGLTIPKLRAYRHALKIIQMDFVRPPYLLDFAGADFKPPDFSDDVMQDWRARISSMFAPNEWLVYAVYNALAKHGLYYTDFRPSNFNLEGHPDFRPYAGDDDAE